MRMFSSTARYSRDSSVASGVTGPSVTGSTWTHSAVPVPGTAVPTVTRSAPADDHGPGSAGEVADLHDLGHHADRGVAPVHVGDEDEPPAGGAGGVGRGPGLLGLEGQGEDHPREGDTRGQGEQGKGLVQFCHVISIAGVALLPPGATLFRCICNQSAGTGIPGHPRHTPPVP